MIDLSPYKDNPLIRLFEEVINEGSLEILDELYTDDYVNHVAPFGLSTGVDGLKKLFGEFIEAFPDQKIVVEQIYFCDDTTIALWRLTATHRGTFFGVEPTNKPIEMTGVDIEKIRDGKICAHYGAEDMLALLEQIGAIDNLKA